MNGPEAMNSRLQNFGARTRFGILISGVVATEDGDFRGEYTVRVDLKRFGFWKFYIQIKVGLPTLLFSRLSKESQGE
jgi:hypothetical protein